MYTSHLKYIAIFQLEMNLRTILSAVALCTASAFNFGGINIPLPSLPQNLPTALPSIPVLPTALPTGLEIPTSIVELPSAFYDSVLPSLPTTIPNIPDYSIPAIKSELAINSRLPYISVPPFPSFDISTALPSILPIPSEFADAIASRLQDINNGLASAGFTKLPTPDRNAVASLRGAIASIREQLGDSHDNLQKLVDSYMNTTQRNFTIPSSEGELRDIIERRAEFNLSRADAILDDLGRKTGQEIHGTIRMISALILQNTTDIYTRATNEFTYHAVRLREGAEQAFNFSQTAIRLPTGLDLQNKTLSIVQYASNPYQFLSGQKVNSQVVSIMIADLAGNETSIRGLQDAINFTLPLNLTDIDYSVLQQPGRATCSYWDTISSTWQTDGCSLIALMPAEATCSCTHLTDFAITSVVVQSTPPTPTSIIPTPATTPATTTATATLAQQPILLAHTATTTTKESTPMLTIVGASVGSVIGALLIGLAVANIVYYRRKQLTKLTTKPIITKSILRV